MLELRWTCYCFPYSKKSVRLPIMSGRANDVCTVFFWLVKVTKDFKVLLKVSVHLNLLNLDLSTSLGLNKIIIWTQSHSGENCIVLDLFLDKLYSYPWETSEYTRLVLVTLVSLPLPRQSWKNFQSNLQLVQECAYDFRNTNYHTKST